MVAASAIEPFTQQVISFLQRLALFSGTATTASIAYGDGFIAGVPYTYGRIGVCDKSSWMTNSIDRKPGLKPIEPIGGMDISMIIFNYFSKCEHLHRIHFARLHQYLPRSPVPRRPHHQVRT